MVGGVSTGSGGIVIQVIKKRWPNRDKLHAADEEK